MPPSAEEVVNQVLGAGADPDILAYVGAILADGDFDWDEAEEALAPVLVRPLRAC